MPTSARLRRRWTVENRGRGSSSPPSKPCDLSEEELSRLVREHCEALGPILDSLASVRHVNPGLTDAIARLIRVGEPPLQAAFLSRSCNALARLTTQLPEDALGDAAGARSDYWVLLHALEEPQTIESLTEDDPLAEARLRDLGVRETILRSEGGVLTVKEVAQRLGISRQAVHNRRRAGRLLALPLGQHRYVYPAWQLESGAILPGIEDVLTEFYEIDPWTQAAFFLSENSYLNGRRPLDELRRGHVESVRRAAGALGEQGAA